MFLSQFNCIGDVIDCDVIRFNSLLAESNANIGELSSLKMALATEFQRSSSIQQGLTSEMSAGESELGKERFEELRKTSLVLYYKMKMIEDKLSIISSEIERLGSLSEGHE